MRVSIAAMVMCAGVALGAACPAPAHAEDEPTLAPMLGAWGDLGGSRTFLEQYGINYRLTYYSNGFANPVGGITRGATWMSRFHFTTDADLEKLAGWKGATFNASVLIPQGKDLSAKDIGNILNVSNIVASPTVRLFQIYIEQALLDGKASVRIGQLAADAEFWGSDYAGLFVNSTFGWPAISAADMPAGGPAYPFASPAVRIKVTPNDNVTWMAGVYNGNPAGNTCIQPNPQNCNKYGQPHFGDGVLAITEAAFAYNKSAGLPGTIRAGAWYNSNTFNSVRFANDGLPLADPDSDGDARKYRGNWGIYGIIDQAIYKFAGSDGTIGVFARAAISPSNRNLISAYFDAGVNVTGFWPARPNDSFGVAFGYAGISSDVRAADRDTYFYTDTFTPARNYEAVLEATYSAQIVPGWTIQPDIQYIFNPGGRILNPYDPSGTRIVKNALVVGFQSLIRY